MATSRSGFMGEPFPSKKFQETMKDFREHGDRLHNEVLDSGFTPTYTEPKMTWDELYRQNLTIKMALVHAVSEIKRLRNQQQS